MKKLTERHVVEMRRLSSESEWTIQRLAARYGVAASTVHHAITGRTWAHVAGPPIVRTDHRVKLTEADVVEMRRLYHDGGWTIEQLTGRSRVSRTTAHNAVRGQTWAHAAGPVG